MAKNSTQHESLWDKVKHAFGGGPSDFDRDEQYYRGQYDAAITSRTGGAAAGAAAGAAPASYDQVRPAYQLGHTAGLQDSTAGRRFEEVEPELRRGYESYAGSNPGLARYEDVRPHIASGYARGQERRIVLSEEQLAVGKRHVAAGEVELRTVVEAERVREQVELRHTEVSVERRPLSADAVSGADLEIREESINVPLTREEAVVEKRVVPVEEVVVRTNTVTENQTVEDTVRRERLVTEGLEQQRGLSGNVSGNAAGAGLSSGAADRATDSGLLDRAADKLDNLKDRVDGNPASRPGPDATDRRI